MMSLRPKVFEGLRSNMEKKARKMQEKASEIVRSRLVRYF